MRAFRLAAVAALAVTLVACAGSPAGRGNPKGDRPAAAEELRQPFAEALRAIKEAHDLGLQRKFAASAAAFRRYQTVYGELAEAIGRVDAGLRKKLDDRMVELAAEYRKTEPRKGEIDEEGVRIAQLLKDAGKLLKVPLPDVEVKPEHALLPPKPFRKQETVTLELTEYRIDPAQLTVDKDTKLKLIVVNKGKQEHNLEIEGYDIDLGDIEPGQRIEAEIVLDRAGRYGLACHKPGHEEAGQVGTLIVR